MNDSPVNAIFWAFSPPRNARIFNNSYMQKAAYTPYSTKLSDYTDNKNYDGYVFNNRMTMIVACGNYDAKTYPSYNVTAPAMAYNCIAVGAFDDKNLITWEEDEVAAFSCYKGPSSTNSDRKKPEVVAPGVSIISTYINSSILSSSGTSFSAPHVTGLAALIGWRNRTLLDWPEAIKAIIMATAVHNLEGSSIPSSNYRDGAGGIVSYFADALANTSQNIVYQYMTKTSTNTLFTFKLGNIFTNPVQRRGVRIVLCWSVDPAFSDYNNKPGTDLDISVYKRNGWFPIYVGGSYSKDNNYEIVEFTTSGNSDTYKISINKTRFDDTAPNGIPFSLVFFDAPVN